VQGAFLVQSIIMYTAGIKLWMRLDNAGAAQPVSTLVCFIVCAPLVAVASEVFYRLIDVPSVVAAKAFWTWMLR
jgi:hypothetical protein